MVQPVLHGQRFFSHKVAHWTAKEMINKQVLGTIEIIRVFQTRWDKISIYKDLSDHIRQAIEGQQTPTEPGRNLEFCQKRPLC